LSSRFTALLGGLEKNLKSKISCQIPFNCIVQLLGAAKMRRGQPKMAQEPCFIPGAPLAETHLKSRFTALEMVVEVMYPVLSTWNVRHDVHRGPPEKKVEGQ
jgi:hypothetical protein